MASLPTVALALTLAASPPATTKYVHRHAAILTAIGSAITVSGAVVLGVGIHRDYAGTETGGAALIAFGLNLVLISIFTWLWPGPVPPPWHATSS